MAKINTIKHVAFYEDSRRSHLSAHVIMILLNELGKNARIVEHLSLFHEFKKFNYTIAPMLDSIYHMTLKLF